MSITNKKTAAWWSNQEVQSLIAGEISHREISWCFDCQPQKLTAGRMSASMHVGSARDFIKILTNLGNAGKVLCSIFNTVYCIGDEPALCILTEMAASFWQRNWLQNSTNILPGLIIIRGCGEQLANHVFFHLSLSECLKPNDWIKGLIVWKIHFSAF